MRLNALHYSFIVIFFLVQAIFIFLRLSSAGVTYYRLVRMHSLVISEFVMVLSSFYIYKRISNALRILEPEKVTPVRFRWRTICLQDVVKALLLLFLILSQICFVFYFVWLGPDPNFLAVISLVSLALYLHIFVFLLFADLVHFIAFLGTKMKICKNCCNAITINRGSYTLLAVSCALIFVCGGLYTTMRDPVYTRVKVPLRKLHSNQDIHLALLSDIHIGPSVGTHRMTRITQLTNQLNPDIIAISGDLADGFVRDFGKAAQPLCNLTARYGVYFATGNHEYMHANVQEWMDFLTACNITVLHNENRRLTLDNGLQVCVAGADDLYAAKAHYPGHGMDARKALKGCRADDTVILLAHQPNAAKIVLNDNTINKNVDLILSGHTHEGQFYLFMPAIYIASAFTRGLYPPSYTGIDSYVYVSAGVNFFGPPIKIFGGCEIIDLTLVNRN